MRRFELNRQQACPVRRLSRGFTLVELMIVVAIIAVLAAVAYPAYQDQVRKSRRAQAKADLVELSQMAERWRTVNNTYATFVPPFTQSPRNGTAQYSIAFAVPTGSISAYTLTATPATATKQNKDKCGILAIDQTNTKKSGAAGTTVDPTCF